MRRITLALALAVACLAAQPLAAQGPASPLPARASTENGVTVRVTPGNLAPREAKTWEFKIVLDTHSQDLGDDLVKSAVLVDGQGRQYRPTGWDGAAPGGHHREGVLRFDALSPPPRAIELQIRRPGEARPRAFRWELE